MNLKKVKFFNYVALYKNEMEFYTHLVYRKVTHVQGIKFRQKIYEILTLTLGNKNK